MAYSSTSGRKPLERASKIAHTSIVNNPAVKRFLDECTIPHTADSADLAKLVESLQPSNESPSYVVAVDGSMSEAPVRPKFPAASVTFFNFGPLLFRLSDLRELDSSAFIAPEDLAKLKKIQRFSLVLPTRNVSRGGRSLRDSFRLALHEFFTDEDVDKVPMWTSLRWLVCRGWRGLNSVAWRIPNCPHPGCGDSGTEFTMADGPTKQCASCGKDVYLVDCFRLHERIDDQQGASAVSSYVLSMLEQICLVHVIRQILSIKPSMLDDFLFIKDGPLACFGMTAPISRPLRELVEHLNGSHGPTLRLAGLEKSGPFVEHAMQIANDMPAGSLITLTNDYIYRYVIPGDPSSPDPYGGNTYWGGKLVLKAQDGNLYVATIPLAGGFEPAPTSSDFVALWTVLAGLSELRCSMYDNALIPVALANRLVSLADAPSSQILETFAKQSVQ